MKLTKEIKIAIVAIVGILVLFFGLNFLKGMTLFSNDNTYYVSFKDISGLSSSNPIYADGYKVGVVKRIQYDYDKGGDILVQINVDQDLRIPKGSSAEIESDIMGNIKMNLLLANNPRERVNPGETMIGSTKNGLMGKVASLVPTVEVMLPKIDSILTKNVPGLLHKANGVLTNADKFTGNLARVDVAGTMSQVDQTIANLKDFTHQLNSRDGSLGLLMHDPTLYNNMNKTMRSADSLLVNVRQHPKRYVHFSVFGRKEK